MSGESGSGQPIASASASGKVILFGEHAVVYGEQAIAVPVPATDVVADVLTTDGAPDLISHFPSEEGRAPLALSLARLSSAESLGRALEADGNAIGGGAALVAVIAAALRHVSLDAIPRWSIRLKSTVPTGRGMGSSAAVAVATARAIIAAAGRPSDGRAAAQIAHHGERVTHGTPSGIDTSVIGFGRPIRFTRERGGEPVSLGAPVRLIIADTGSPGQTRDMVAGVRERRAAHDKTYGRLIARIGEIADAAIGALANGGLAEIGRLMDENHAILKEMQVSTAEIERLVDAAGRAGALGAKLSGAGGGGVTIALAESAESSARIAQALRAVGAPRVYVSTIEPLGIA